jgi:hypothetical protein
MDDEFRRSTFDLLFCAVAGAIWYAICYWLMPFVTG